MRFIIIWRITPACVYGLFDKCIILSCCINHMLKSFGLIRVWNELYSWHCDSLLNLDLLCMFFCWPVFLRKHRADLQPCTNTHGHSRFSIPCKSHSRTWLKLEVDWRLLFLYSRVKRCREHELSSPGGVVSLSRQTWQQLLSLSLCLPLVVT